MAGLFAITALAIAAERANAVGAVRLTCLPEGLEIELLRAAGFTEGFAPSSVAESVSFTVPYTAVRGLVRRGRALCLALDPAVVTPHNRFALVRFTDDPAEVLAGTYRARLVARWLSFALPLPLALLAVLLAPSNLVGGALGLASLALVVALGAWLALREAVRWLTFGGPASDAYRDAFEIELSRRLGLAPAQALVTPPWESPWESPAPENPLAAASMRARAISAEGSRRWRLILGLSGVSLSVVGGMAFLKHFAAPRDIAPPSAAVATGIASAARRLAELEPTIPRGPVRPRCLCRRADSPLWKEGIPALSILLFDQPDDGSGRVAPTIRQGRRPRYDFDLAVVNNGDSALRDVRLVLTFARRDEAGQRAGVTDRGLFWEGALRPGRAVKWRVRAPGTEMKIESSVNGTLEQAGVLPADADAFYDLLDSRYRIVRVHGAMMLAYLRDPRALDAVRSLGVAPEGEALTVARIERAAAPVIACDIAVRDGSLEVCVFNSTERPAGGLRGREIPAEKGGISRTFAIEGSIPVHEGEVISVPLEGGDAPEEIVIESAAAAPAAP
ncbi:MAG: hypothetical protein HUU21_34890 [Polyangiaceae bacterium]|nr:hypothetical protein [Polyangiaceae bacterium]